MSVLINSCKNEQFKLLKSLLTSKGIKKHNLCLVMGRKISLKNCKVEFKVYPKGYSPISNDFKHLVIKNDLFNEIDVLNTKHPISVVKTFNLPKWEEENKIEGKEVLVPLSDPTNLGSLIRSCTAFGIDKIILLSEAANPFLPKVIKSSNASIFKIKIYQGPRSEDLKKFMALNSNEGEDINNFRWPDKGRLLIGAERGLVLDKKAKTEFIHIPMLKNMDSLSAPIAGSIAIYNWINFKKEKA